MVKLGRLEGVIWGILGENGAFGGNFDKVHEMKATAEQNRKSDGKLRRN
jgi:hypothetical protein